MHYNEIYKDEHAKINGYLENVTFKDGSTAVMPMPPIEFNNYDKTHTVPTGGLSENRNEILTAAGYSKKEIEEMKELGIIG